MGVRVALGTAPDSWGVWFPSDSKQIPWPRFLDEVAKAGYRWIELGPFGYLPMDPGVLKSELFLRDLRVSGTFTMFHFEDQRAWASQAEEIQRLCRVLEELEASYLILIDDLYTHPFTGEQIVPDRLDEDGWKQLIDTVHCVSEIAAAHGLRTVLHPHAQTHIEYEHQIVRFLSDADQKIGLCLDLGHHAYLGGDPVAFLRQYHDRITYLHVKSVDADVSERVRQEGIPFAQAVAMGVFVEPSEGVIDFQAVRDALEEFDYEGFAIVEQDMYPAEFAKPLPIARRTREYLVKIGIT
jgi:inosose dehydratase